MSLQPTGQSTSSKFKLDNDVTDAEIKSSIKYVDGLAQRRGKTYWPIIERLAEPSLALVDIKTDLNQL